MKELVETKYLLEVDNKNIINNQLEKISMYYPTKNIINNQLERYLCTTLLQKLNQINCNQTHQRIN